MSKNELIFFLNFKHNEYECIYYTYYSNVFNSFPFEWYENIDTYRVKHIIIYCH